MISKLINKLFRGKSQDPQALKQQASKRQEENEDVHSLDFDLMSKSLFIHYEATYRYQKISFRRSTDSNRITLGEILSSLFNESSSTVNHLAITYRAAEFGEVAEESIITDSEQIWNFDLFGTILKNKTDDGHYTQGMFHETTLIVQTNKKTTF